MSINPENASAVAAPYSRAQKVYVRNVIIELFGAMRELSLKQFLTDDMYLFFVTMIEEVLLARTNATNGRAFKAKIDLVRSFVNQNGRPFRASVEQVEAAIADGTVPRTYVMVNGRSSAPSWTSAPGRSRRKAPVPTPRPPSTAPLRRSKQSGSLPAHVTRLLESHPAHVESKRAGGLAGR